MSARTTNSWRHWVGLMFSGQVASASTISHTTRTNVTSNCSYSNYTCGESSDYGTPSGYPADDPAKNDDNYEGLKCPAITAIAGVGAYFSGGSSVPWSMGIAAASCGVSQM